MLVEVDSDDDLLITYSQPRNVLQVDANRIIVHVK